MLWQQAEAPRKLFWNVLGLLSILTLMTFQFAVVGKYASYPWWHQHDCDSDPLYVAQAITLVNDGPFDYIHHPGAVVSSGHALAYRVASAVVGWHPEYLDLPTTAATISPWTLLDDATHVSRWLAFAVFAVFVATFYGLVLWITREGMVTFLVTFFVATSEVAVWHSRAIRPEVPSLVFCLSGLWVVLGLNTAPCRNRTLRLTVAGPILGFVLALAMLAKIQVLPIVTFLLALALWRVASDVGNGTARNTNRALWTTLALGVVVAAVTPWWALARPDFLTESFLQSAGYFDRLVYGSLEATFAPLVAVALGLSLCVTVAAIIAFRRFGESRRVLQLARVIEFSYLVALGAITATYCVVAPSSRTIASYAKNTHHLVYGVIANTFGNVFGTGFLHHKTLDDNTAARIFDAHQRGDPLLGTNILWLVGLVIIVAIIRLSTRPCVNRTQYLEVLMFLGVGLAMDVVFTLRWSAQFNYYALFSLVFYGLAFAQFLNVNRPLLRARTNRLGLSAGVSLIIFALLVSHVGFRTFEIVTAPRATGISDQQPTPMLEASKGQNRHFWLFFDETP